MCIRAHKNIHVTDLRYMRVTFINQYRSVSGTPNKTEDRANTIDWLIYLFNTPAWQDCYIDSDKKLQPTCRKYPRVTMRMTCRFIPERGGVEKRYPRGASRLKTMAICDIRQTCRSRIHNVSSKHNRLESRRRYTPRRYASRGWKLYTRRLASCAPLLYVLICSIFVRSYGYVTADTCASRRKQVTSGYACPQQEPAFARGRVV